MAVSLSKDGNVSLSKSAPLSTKALMGAGRDPRNADGAAFDLDASAFLLGPSGKFGGDADFVLYNNLNGAEWKLRAVGQGYSGGLAAMLQQFGVNAG